MKRRDFLVWGSSFLASPLVSAQTKPRTLGILTLNPPQTPEELAKNPFMQRLAKLGWAEGRNLAVVRRAAAGRVDLLPGYAAELVAKRVDVIWAYGSEAAVATARATKTIPIVFWGAPFPVEQGLVESLARPGRNVTGVALVSNAEVIAKRLQFLREIAPGVVRVAWIDSAAENHTVSGTPYSGWVLQIETAAREHGFELQRYAVATPSEVTPALESIRKSRAQGVLVAVSPATFIARRTIADALRQYRLPAAYGLKDYVEAGGMVSYGPDWVETTYQSLAYIDRVLRGAKPADLPVELPSKYELAVNTTSAKALGLVVPQSFLARADRVIE